MVMIVLTLMRVRKRGFRGREMKWWEIKEREAEEELLYVYRKELMQTEILYVEELLYVY